MNRTKLWRRVAIAALVLLGTTGGAFAALHQMKIHREGKHKAEAASEVVQDEAHSAASPSPSSANRKLVRVHRIADEQNAVSGGSEFTGSVRARYATDMAFRVAGKVLRRHIEVGQRVQRGQLLFELDPVDYDLQLKSAEANLEVARAAVQQSVAEEKRLLELRRTSAVSASEYERGLSDRDIAIGRQRNAEKQLELAQNQLTYCRLLADEDGIVTNIEIEAGQVVTTGLTVCSIAQERELEAVIDIPENRLPKERDLTTEVTFWSLPGVHCQARLRELSPTADPVSRTFRGRFSLIDPPSAVKLGMTATVNLTNRSADHVFSVPATSITRVEGHSAVWRVTAAGELEQVPVEIKELRQSHVLINGGLTTGDRIVSAGVQKLDATMRVRVWEPQQ